MSGDIGDYARYVRVDFSWFEDQMKIGSEIGAARVVAGIPEDWQLYAIEADNVDWELRLLFRSGEQPPEEIRWQRVPETRVELEMIREAP